MVTGLSRALVPSWALLLFLIVTTTPTLLSSRADGAISTANEDSTENTESCPTEEFACLDDETCSSCLAVTVTGSAEVNECVELASSSATTVCTSGMGAPCCMDEVSEHDCLYNEPFVEYMLCALENEGRLADEISCDSVGSLSGSSGGNPTASVWGRATAMFVLCNMLFSGLLPFLGV